MKDPIQDTIQRTQRYWYTDGANEIGTGLVILLLAFSFKLLDWLNPDGNFGWVVGILQPVVILAGFWVTSRLVRAFKEQVTYPRTGYVSYPRKPGKRRLTLALIGGGTAALMSAILAVVADRLGEDILPIICGVVVASSVAYMGMRFGLTRFYVLAAFTFVSGVITTLSGAQGLNSSVLLFGLMGAGWVLSGCWALVGYLRSTQPADEGDLG
jgi:hypothetical protein